MLFYIVFCLFSALTVGLVSIFLGLGGGVTLVPLLNIYFLFEKYPQELIFQLAVFHALVIMALSSIYALFSIEDVFLYLHKKRFWLMALGAVFGLILGARLAFILPFYVVKILFLIFLFSRIVISLQDLGVSKFRFSWVKLLKYNDFWLKYKGLFYGFFAGSIGPVIGAGGGVFFMPVLLSEKMPAPAAVIASSVLICLTSFIGTLLFLIGYWWSYGSFEVLVDFFHPGYVLFVSLVAGSLSALVYRFKLSYHHVITKWGMLFVLLFSFSAIAFF